MALDEIIQARLIDGRFQVIQPDETSRPAAGRTDWARLRAMSEAEIEAAARSDPDNPPMSDEQWRGSGGAGFWLRLGSVVLEVA